MKTHSLIILVRQDNSGQSLSLSICWAPTFKHSALIYLRYTVLLSIILPTRLYAQSRGCIDSETISVKQVAPLMPRYPLPWGKTYWQIEHDPALRGCTRHWVMYLQDVELIQTAFKMLAMPKVLRHCQDKCQMWPLTQLWSPKGSLSHCFSNPSARPWCLWQRRRLCCCSCCSTQRLTTPGEWPWDSWTVPVGHFSFSYGPV